MINKKSSSLWQISLGFFQCSKITQIITNINNIRPAFINLFCNNELEWLAGNDLYLSLCIAAEFIEIHYS